MCAENGTQVSWKNLLLTTEPFFLVPILGNLVGSKLKFGVKSVLSQLPLDGVSMAHFLSYVFIPVVSSFCAAQRVTTLTVEILAVWTQCDTVLI